MSPLMVEVPVLDVRPTLSAGRDPLGDILAAVGATPPGHPLIVIAPFAPRPLLVLLGARGHALMSVTAETEGAHVVLILVGGGLVEDLVDLEPPGPLEAVLAAAERGGPYLARVPRFPRLLIPLLRDRGVPFASAELLDGRAVVWVGPR